MSNKFEIGRIDKVSITELNKESKKLLEIPLLFYKQSINFSLPDEYDKKIDEFFEILGEWSKQLSEKIGKIQKIFVESITQAGEEAHLQLRQILRKNIGLLNFIEGFLKSGALLEKTEDADLLAEHIAWVNDANSPNALDLDKKYVIITRKERANYISNRIQETLSEGEIACLLISLDLASIIEYPKVLEVIKFRPPVIDDILKFLQ